MGQKGNSMTHPLNSSAPRIRQLAREFVIWRELRRGAQSHEEVAERVTLPLNFVKGVIRKKGWLFRELPQYSTADVDKAFNTMELRHVES